MKQISIFDIEGVEAPKPKSSKRAMDDRSSMHREPPLPLSTVGDVQLTGGDAARVLQGEPRDTVIAERVKASEARRNDPNLHRHTFVNIADNPLTFIDPVGNYCIRCAPHDSVWMRPVNHEKLDEDVRRFLVPSVFAMGLVMKGKIKPTPALIKTFVESGLLDPRSSVHEVRPTHIYDATVDF
jgi:hypothetical protein